MKTQLQRSAALGILSFATLCHYAVAQTQSNVSYGSDAKQKLDYYSASTPNAPIIIVVHGGGWFAGDKNGPSYKNAAQLLNNQGYAAVNINYRLTENPNPVTTYPSHIEDLACALAWTKNNATLFNGDSAKVAIYGHSAGGQIAAYLGVRPLNAMLSGCSYNAGLNVDGVLLTSATVDFDLTNPNNWQPIINMLGDTALYWDIAQPTHHCANNFDTKFLIMCGEFDTLGIQQDSAFHDSLTKYNHCSVLKMFPGNDHNTIIDSLTATDTVFKAMLNFLDSLWTGNPCSPGLPVGIEPTEELKKNTNVLVFPNPVNGTSILYISHYTGSKIEKAEVNIINLTGKKVFEKTLNLYENSYNGSTAEQETLHWTLESGIYFLYIKSDTFVQTLKLVVLK